jgi:uncharacterized protein (DUF697 family)
MRLFRRKSTWDRVRDAMEATMAGAVASGGIRRVTKMAAGVIGGAAAATAASAVVSSVRRKDDES